MIPETRRTPVWLHPYLAAALSVVSAAAVSWILRDFGLSPGWKLAVAFLGIIPAVALVLAMYLWVRSLDEMQRRIQAEALALAFSASMLAGLVLQFVQKAGVG